MKSVKRLLSGAFIVVLSFIIFGLGGLIYAQGTKKIYIIKTMDNKYYNDAIAGFKSNCPGVYKEFNINNNLAIAKSYAEQINAAHPDLVLAVGAKALIAAKNYIDPSIPVVFTVVLNPDRLGIKAPNITGVRLEISVDLQLRAIKAIVPNIKRIGVLYNPENSKNLIEEAKKVAAKLGLQLVAQSVETEDDTVDALQLFAAGGGIDAYWLIPDPTVVTQKSFQEILKFTTQKRIPTFVFSKLMVKRGAFIAINVGDYVSLGTQACEIAQKIFSGIPPSEIPYQYPRGLEIAVNVSVARLLNLNQVATNAIMFASKNGYKITPLQ